MNNEIYGLAVIEHDRANRTYCGYSYELHLKGVLAACDNFAGEYLGLEQINIAQAACACHDLIEDCGMNYSDVKRLVDSTTLSAYATEVADIVYAVSNELGKNRKERAQKTYPKIKENDLAIFVKLCDRIANSLFSLYTHDQKMLELYAGEYKEFKKFLYKEGQYEKMWACLEKIYSI